MSVKKMYDDLYVIMQGFMKELHLAPDPKIMSQVLKLLPEFDKVERQLSEEQWADLPAELQAELERVLNEYAEGTERADTSASISGDRS